MVLVLLLVVVVALTTGASATGRLSGSLARCLAAFLRPSYGLAALLYYIVLHHFYMILYYILIYYIIMSCPGCLAALLLAPVLPSTPAAGRLAVWHCKPVRSATSPSTSARRSSSTRTMRRAQSSQRGVVCSISPCSFYIGDFVV